MSAGQVGCLPAEIEIHSEGWSPGWGGSTETWIAECQGRTYVCSNVQSSVGTDTVSQVTCAEHGGDTDAPLEPVASREPEPPPAHRTAPPTGGAGFDFGIAGAEGRTACEAAGNAWQAASNKSATCSGPAVDLGFPASIALSFCSDRLCSVVVEHRPESDWLDPITELRSKLEEKYGKPEARAGSIPKDCRAREAFAKCVEGDLRLAYKWSWSSGELITLSVGKPESGDGNAAIRIQYTRPFRSMNASPSAL